MNDFIPNKNNWKGEEYECPKCGREGVANDFICSDEAAGHCLRCPYCKEEGTDEVYGCCIVGWEWNITDYE